MHGREASEACGLFAFEVAKLRHFDQQSKSGDLRDARDREENLEPASELRVIEDELFDRGVDLLDFDVYLGEALFVLLFEQGKRDCLGAVFGGGAVFDESGPSDMQLLQFGDGLADARPWFEAENLAHAREHGGVDPIGFDELAGRLGETARLAGIDFGDRQTGGVERAFERTVIRACRLEHNALCRRGDQPFDQGFAAALVVGETARGAIGKTVDIEKIFRDINANGRRIHLFRAFACHSGQKPEYPSRPKEKTRAIKL